MTEKTTLSPGRRGRLFFIYDGVSASATPSDVTNGYSKLATGTI